MIKFEADLELTRRGEGYAMRGLSIHGREFLDNFVGDYKTAEKALTAVGLALKRKLRVAINIPIEPVTQ